MKTINDIADSIYSYCTLAMDYDLDGLIFNSSSLISAIAENKYSLMELTEKDFNILKESLEANILELYEKNKVIAEQSIEESDVVKKFKRDSAKAEREEAKKFITYINRELDYEYFKQIVG